MAGGMVAMTAGLVAALDNGAANTPPLGWCSWQRYRCAIDCGDATSPNCFNEGLIRATADAMAASPLREAGYEYVALDDCWQAPKRVNGHVVADPKRFPSGIKALADYVHSKGLKFGLYTAVGNNTCASHKFAVDPIGLGCDYDNIPKCAIAKRDIDDYVSWGIDHLKDAVKARGKGPVVYHPSNLGFEFPRQFRELASIGNQWRFQTDVQDSWSSVVGIIEAIGAGQPTCTPGPLPENCTGRLRGAESVWCASFCVERDEFLRVPGRGGWHDPDMLLAGQTPCSPAATQAGMHCNVLPLVEQQTQMAIWSMASAPLLLSADLTNFSNDSMAIVTNPGALAIDQDSLGRMPFRFISDTVTGVDVWRKDLAGGDVAIAVVNMGIMPMNRTPGKPVRWSASPGLVYSDAICQNIDGPAAGGICSHMQPSQVTDCCKAHCVKDSECNAINVNTELQQCVKRACPVGKVNHPDTPKEGWTSFGFDLPPPDPLNAGYQFKLTDAGYAFNTRVSAWDVFGKRDLGVHVGTFSTPSPIEGHGTLLLRLSYAPLYPSRRQRSLLDL